MRYKICQAQAFGRSSGYFIHGFEYVPVEIMVSLTVYTRSRQPTARVPRWYAKQFLMARRSSMFFTSILLWFTQKINWPWLVQKYVGYVVGTLNDLKPFQFLQTTAKFANCEASISILYLSIRNI